MAVRPNAEAQREGWLGEVEGLQVSPASANDKLAQLDRRAHGLGNRRPGHPAGQTATMINSAMQAVLQAVLKEGSIL